MDSCDRFSLRAIGRWLRGLGVPIPRHRNDVTMRFVFQRAGQRVPIPHHRNDVTMLGGMRTFEKVFRYPTIGMTLRW